MSFKKNKINIEFISTVKGLEMVEDAIPKPANKFLPEWWKNFPKANFNNGNVRNCPSFPDFFSSGYVVPMWMDSLIKYNKETDEWSASGSSSFENWTVHTNEQFIDYVDARTQGLSGNIVFKAACPWRIITPKGWSVLQLPLFYHFNKEFSVLPGIIDTDIHHQINQQVLYHGNNKDIYIPRGTPLAMYIPFKREKPNMLVRYMTDSDNARFIVDNIKNNTKFIGEGAYRSMQRERDK